MTRHRTARASYSADAGVIGNNLGPDAAYRFTKGEVVTSSIWYTPLWLNRFAAGTAGP